MMSWIQDAKEEVWFNVEKEAAFSRVFGGFWFLLLILLLLR
jgi:hypothetical protein